MRVNTIKWSVEDAVDWFVTSGWAEIHLDDFIQRVEDKQQVFARDDHLSSVLALSRTVNLNALAPYLDGRLIAQDKASCMPAQLLLGSLTPEERKRGVCVIDATAAPGNKTTMLSALVGTSGKVWAFEKDPERFETLKSMVAKAGCRNVECIRGDFLSVKTNDSRFHNVTHILLDPSCCMSGSGISNRLDHLVGTQRDEGRIKSLARFQTTILSHALRFKSVTQVAYSTCSIWREEDEEVVFRVLGKPEMSKKGWQLKDLTDALKPGKPWKRLGRPRSDMEKALTDRMVRFDPKLDTTIGFFAAVFIRNLSSPSIDTKVLNPSHPPQSQACPTEPICIKKRLCESNKRWHGIRAGRLLYL
ncbi:S-adenosyl-L-methionine-dependent methyltransferase [Melampsora americana]|nr:S-adenosyl-L-methionine-dependent methyltransferase [Melampsora americana]